MDRRDFLRMTGGMGAASLLWSGGVLMRTAHAAASGQVLVVVFQRGGWDGLNVSVPYGEDAYYKLRPTIAVPPPSANTAEAALDLNGFFGFHPALAPLRRLGRRCRRTGRCGGGRVVLGDGVKGAAPIQIKACGRPWARIAFRAPLKMSFLAEYCVAASSAMLINILS